MNGIHALIKETPERSLGFFFFFLSFKDTVKRLANYE